MPSLPLLVPVLIVGVVTAVAVYRPLSRWLPSPAWSSLALILSLAIVVAITLTPQDLSAIRAPRWWPVAWLVQALGERWLNVLLFVPLGIAVMFIGRSRLRLTAILGAVALPWVVEAIQHVVTPLARDSQWQDVVDNTAGVLIGLVIGRALEWWREKRSSVSPPGPSS